MGDILFYIAAFIFVIALIIIGSWVWRMLLEKGVGLPAGKLFKSPSEKRIGAIETAAIDAKRKLVLIRRDNVEHLIMTGGPVDVVIETGIGAGAPPAVHPASPDGTARPSGNAHDSGHVYGYKDGGNDAGDEGEKNPLASSLLSRRLSEMTGQAND